MNGIVHRFVAGMFLAVAASMARALPPARIKKVACPGFARWPVFRSRRPGVCVFAPCAEPGRSLGWPLPWPWSGREGRWPNALHVRIWEVGLDRSINAASTEKCRSRFQCPLSWLVHSARLIVIICKVKWTSVTGGMRGEINPISTATDPAPPY